MSTSLLALLSAYVALFVPAAPAAVSTPPPSPSDVVSGVQRFYQDSKDLKADFTQTYVYKVYGREQVSSGKVYLKKPDRMRWDYVVPVPKLFVADGETLWVYEPAENQVFKRGLKSSQLPVALTFMSGRGRLDEAFTPQLLAPKRPGTFQLQLIPKVNEGDYQSLELTVDMKSFAVLESTVVDPVGNTNTVVFKNVEVNRGLPDKGFVFTPPAGVRVLNAPSGP
ncbi:MAG: outer membrane lipoprotein chaperone LolA [Myxococcales bacterium]|nr:outer membrane lipoprotein chaperone LolA [Myxococcales bacterium]